MASGAPKRLKTGSEPFAVGERGGVVRGLRVRAGTLLRPGEAVCTLEAAGVVGQRVLFHRDVSDALVVRLQCREGEAVAPGACLFEYRVCEHGVVVRGLCVSCGCDMSRRPGPRAAATAAAAPPHVQLLPAQPDLLVDASVARSVADAVARRLTASRKLSLVLDLDLTLLHATSDPRHGRLLTAADASAAAVRDVERLTIGGRFARQHWIKLRPGLRAFMARVSELYELHIFTHGAKEYGQRVADLLDPGNVYFAPQAGVGERRVTTVDDAYSEAEHRRKSATHQYKRLERLFPVSDAHVLVLDDNNVWGGSPNVVRVVPYLFWRNLPVEKPSVFVVNGDEADTADPVAAQLCDEDAAHDTHLQRVLGVLERVHELYYAEPDPAARHVVSMFARVRATVLHGCVVAFSSVFPVGHALARQPLAQLVVDYGGTVAEDVHAHVTHLVCGQGGTQKVRAATALGVHVVHVGWLFDSVRQYQRQAEDAYATLPAERTVDESLLGLMKQLAHSYVARRSPAAAARTASADADEAELDHNEMLRLLEDSAGGAGDEEEDGWGDEEAEW